MSCISSRDKRIRTSDLTVPNREIARHRIVVEHTISQLNRFTASPQEFRGWECNHEVHHSQAVRVVARLVNRRTRQRPLKVYAKAA